MDGTKANILYNSDDVVEIDSPEQDWNPYDDGIRDESCDMYDKLLKTDIGLSALLVSPDPSVEPNPGTMDFVPYRHFYQLT
ncbi:Hypothetical predicted protein [Octopus vulgaris]|uniref:Uncharacterized protein n=1 Tax=Octopus vulgaris TaxID=6645 RepID=A0AA36BFS7_OCTVU|nr:Hypothetical predicted protein [Octopus vulgaris]